MTDTVKDNELKILYCPSKEMIAEFYTKPLQGILFKEHINSLLGINEDDMTLYLEQYTQFMKPKNID